MPRLSLALFCALFVALLLGSGGCSAIVSSDVPAFTCSGTSLQACPPGQYCKGAGCVACEKEDVCDGLDNDCNGLIDDGPSSDRDGDGYTFCGRYSQDEGRLVDVDCDDNNPDIHPGAEEVCNGLDDDCDQVIDNPDRVCPAGQVCAPRGGGCIPQTEACTPQNCAPPKQCDPQTQQCINPTADLPLGAACGSDQECASGICASASMLGGAIKGPKGVCTKPCCTSGQCAPGFVCFAPGTGGRYCLDSDTVGRTPTPGIADSGANCKNDSDCRSGLCNAGTCLDTCCSDGDCTSGGLACALVSAGGKTFFGCAPPAGPGNANDSCGGPADCRTNFCAAYGSPPAQSCVAPCCSSNANCGTGISCVNARTTLSSPILTVCIGTTPKKANKSFGDSCSADNECTTGLCDAVTARCSSVCCLDSDCPRSTPCRPAPSGVLRCVP